MDMIFRLARAEELQGIKELYKEATDDMRSRGVFQWDNIYPSEELLGQDIEKREMYLLVCGEEVISAVVINGEQLEEYESIRWKYGTEKIAVIHRLCVSPAHQGKGYGSEMVLRAEEVMKAMGYTAVRLDAFSQNPSALKLYERLGYERAGEVRFRTGDFFLYEKTL